MMPDRLPPHALEAEQGILGCCLLDTKEALASAIAAGVGPKFYDLRHREIFSALEAMQDAPAPVDIITIQQWLKDQGKLDAVGGLAYLSSLQDATPSAANLDYYLRIVAEKYYARVVIQKATDLVAKAYEDTTGLPGFADLVESEIFSLRGPMGVQAGSRQASFERIIARLEEAQEQNRMPGLECGYPDLDYILGGFRPGAFLTLAARPAMGKSSLAMNIAEKLAYKQGIPVGFFSLEMSEDELNFRSLGSCASVNMQEMLDRRMWEGESVRLVGIISGLSKAPLHILDRSDMTISQMRAEARRLVSQHHIKLLIVDYLQLVSGSRRYENRTQEVSEVSRGLKSMARELKIPVLALAQLNREYDKEEGRRPRLNELRESGSIEADSDVVMFIWAKKDASDSDMGKALTVSVAKNRFGPVGEVPMIFLKRFTRFENAAKINQEDLPQ